MVVSVAPVRAAPSSSWPIPLRALMNEDFPDPVTAMFREAFLMSFSALSITESTSWRFLLSMWDLIKVMVSSERIWLSLLKFLKNSSMLEAQAMTLYGRSSAVVTLI